MSTLRLRPGVHYAPLEGGVYFSSARATFVMKGPAVLFRVVDTCVPLMEDGTDIDQLVAAIGSPSARPLISHLVDTLDSRGLVLHLDQLLVGEPSAEDRQRFPETLAYLESYSDDPYADFRRIRRSRVLLCGPAEALGPAARGLVRAGIGHLVLATPQPHRLAPMAARYPQIALLLHLGEGIPTLLAGRLPQVAVIFTEDAFPTEAIGQLPPSCASIPVRLGKELAIVGPTLRCQEEATGAERLWFRAARWSRLDGDDLLVRPSGDLLAGALAGQAALDALIGLNTGRVHLVHGPDLSSDSITPALAGGEQYDEPVELGGRPSDEGAVAPSGWLEPASARWAGLFRLSVPGDLPQMPLALTLADGRTRCFDGRVVGFGPDQETSTTEASLEALRQHSVELARLCPETGQVAPVPEGSTDAAAAAGLDQARALLDGALRLLAGWVGDAHPIEWLGIDDIEVRRLWRTLEDHELTPVWLRSSQVPGFGWSLVTVHDRRSGARLSSGWGPTTTVGAVAALSAGLACAQVRRTVDPGYAPPSTGPGYLGHLHDGYQAELTTEVVAWLRGIGRRLHGRRLHHDPVAGSLGAWCGTVWLGD
jgi:hypothetical protein